MRNIASIALASVPALLAVPAVAQWQFAVTRHNANGSLDASFDGDGKVLTNFASMAEESSSAAVVDSLGRIVVAGAASPGSTSDSPSQLALARYNDDGGLDASFDADGKVLTDIAASSTEYATGLAIQSDAKIVVAGDATVDGKRHFALARYHADGSLDSTFDGDGHVLTNFASSQGTFVNDVVIQADGKIVVCGTADIGGEYQFALARYHSTGALDTTFDGDGKVLTDFTSSWIEMGNGCAITSTGKVVVGGHARVGSDVQFAVARYNSNGSLDSSFDGDGKVLTSWSPYTSARISDIAVDSADRIVAVGHATPPSSGTVVTMARYTVSGALDTSFGGGKVISNFSETDAEFPMAVALDPSGRIVIAGYGTVASAYHFVTARFTSSGNLDALFGGNGRVVTNFASMAHESGMSVAIDAAGRIVTGGSARP